MNQEQIAQRIQKSIECLSLEVSDLTGGGDHYEVTVTSAAFQGLSRIQQQRIVMSIFDEELKSGELHALSIKTIVPTK